MPRVRSIRRIAVASAVLVLAGTLQGVGPAAAETVRTVATADSGADRARDKLTRATKRELADGQRDDYWVRLATPDLGALEAVTDWDERGRRVYAELRRAARTTQADVRALLQDRGAEYTPYWISNAVLVHDGNLALATDLAREAEVTEIRATSSWATEEPAEVADSSTDNGVVTWGLGAIRADDVWADGVDGSGITVASLDSGVDVTHPALRARYRGLADDGSLDNDYSWYDVADVCPTTDPCDENGHGTHTTGTMLGSAPDHQIGVAPGASWIGVNGCAGGRCSDEDLLASAQWLLAPTRTNGTGADPTKRPHLINNSWSADAGSSGDPFFDEVLTAWRAAGIFNAWSIGNSGPSCGTAAAPGGRGTAYSVGAYDHTGDIAFFSSRGPSADGEAKPNIAAPGVDVVSSFPGGGYRSYNGTSMAAPHVAGAVALLWSAQPDLIGNLDATERLLDRTAHDVDDATCGGTAADNGTWGEGTLDAAALVAAAPTAFGAVTGTVVDDAGLPAPDAVVSASGDLESSVAAGSDGAFSLKLLPGAYTVTVSAFGYVAQTRTVDIPDDGGVLALGEIALATAARHTVAGMLTHPGGEPVIEARVTMGPGLEPATTGTDGAFSFAGVPEGSHTIRVAASPCGTAVVQDLIVDGDETVDLEQEARSALGYDGCRRIVGGFRSGTEQHTFAAGAPFTMDLPFPMVWFGTNVRTIVISPKGFVRFDPPPPDPRDQPIRDDQGLPDGRIAAGVLPFFDDLRTAAVYTDTTTVGDEDAFVVEWRNASFSPESHPAGDANVQLDFSLTLAESGDAIIGWGPGAGADPYRSGTSATIGFQSAVDPGGQTGGIQYSHHTPAAADGRGLLLDARPTGFVHVSLGDANDGLPVALARVRFTGEAGTSTYTTDLGGRTDVQLPLGAYTMSAEVAGYAPFTTEVDIATAGEEHRITAQLETGAPTVAAGTLSWLLGPRDKATGRMTVTNTGGEPMTVSFAEAARDSRDVVAPATAPPPAEEDAPPAAARNARVLTSWTPKYRSSTGIAFDGRSLWVNDQYGETIARYRTDGTLLGEIPAEWDPVTTLDSVADLAYDSRTGHLCELIRPEGGMALRCFSRTDGARQIDLSGTWTGAGPAGVAYNAEEDVFYLSGYGHLITVAGTTHPSPGRLVRSCEAPFQSSRGLAYDPTTRTVWEVGQHQDYPGLRSPTYDLVQQLATDSCEVVSTATLPDETGQPGGLDIDPAGRLWMTDPSTNMVSLLDVDHASPTDLPWLTVPPGTTTIPAGGSRSYPVSVDGAAARPGLLGGNVVVRTSSGRATSSLVPVTVTRSAYRLGVNTGGKAYRDPAGFSWNGDRAFRAGQWGYESRSTVVRTSKPISGTTSDPLFRAVRVAQRDSLGYRFSNVPAGTYSIELGFAEIAGLRRGKRVFDVRVDGRTVLRKVDAARAGRWRALVRTIRVTHRRGPLTITFAQHRGTGQPMVSTIRVTERPDW